MTRNQSFNKANAARKRVLIAKDVLLQIAQNKYRMTKGNYFTACGVPYSFQLSQETIDDVSSCIVCGIGAAFCSALRLGNKFEKMVGYIDSIVMRKEMLYRYFDVAQVDIIEYAFEGWNGIPHCSEFHDHMKNKNPMDRDAVAKAIFQNIIDNKGTFKPEDYLKDSVDNE